MRFPIDVRLGFWHNSGQHQVSQNFPCSTNVLDDIEDVRFLYVQKTTLLTPLKICNIFETEKLNFTRTIPWVCSCWILSSTILSRFSTLLVEYKHQEVLRFQIFSARNATASYRRRLVQLITLIHNLNEVDSLLEN